MRFNNRVILVTGAASGIGLAAARQFLSEGATVIATDINAAALDSMAKEGSGKLVTRVSSAASTTDITDLATWLEKDFGQLDVLVNNAGFAFFKDPEEVDEEEYRAQMDVLLTGPVFYVKHLAKLLRQSTNGSVVNISSASALVSLPGYCPYALAKAAIHKFSEDCVMQVPGIRHNTIMPGFIDTPILEVAYGEEAVTQIAGLISQLEPVKRMGTPDEIASSILFLASDEAAYINGASIVVDGGLSRLNTAVSLLGGKVSLA